MLHAPSARYFDDEKRKRERERERERGVGEEGKKEENSPLTFLLLQLN